MKSRPQTLPDRLPPGYPPTPGYEPATVEFWGRTWKIQVRMKTRTGAIPSWAR